MQVSTLRLHSFNIKENEAVQLARLSGLRRLELSHVSFEGRTLVSKLSTLKVGCIPWCSPEAQPACLQPPVCITGL
jgi:hypothetical protein